ncbi:MAG: heavy metal translocating P-type ATPase, partial [Pseudomonadota bacterium]
QAQGARLPIQDVLTTVTAWFVPAVLGVAFVTVVLWLLFGPAPALPHALVAGVSVLIIACPCAMGLATPTSIMVGTGRAAELGVLFRRGAALQVLDGVDVVAFDKTGTLTQGKPTLTDIELVFGQTEAGTLALAAAIEAQSEHPVAKAVVAAARARGVPLSQAAEVTAVPGQGVSGQVSGAQVLLGSARFLQAQGVDLDALRGRGAQLADQGKTPLYLAHKGQALAVMAVADPLKPEAAEVVSALKAKGLTVAMVTGDTPATAAHIAHKLGIERVEADVQPEGKAEAVARLQSGGQTVAFVGDGINDAPALASADVGLAIGTGTDVAIEAADMVLVQGDLRAVLQAVAISRATLRNIRQNLFWAFAYNVLLIPVAAGGLALFGGAMLSPMLAAGAMALSSVFVVSNALRLRWAGGVVAAEPGATVSEVEPIAVRAA